MQQLAQDDYDSDRRPRFTADANRERAASQPPRSSASPLYSFRDPQVAGQLHDQHPSPITQTMSQQWTQPRYTPLSRPAPSTPTRSASFSAMSERAQGTFASSVRADRAFPSTFEDEEDGLDNYDAELYQHVGRSMNGGHPDEPTRSRSQSLATPARVGLTLNTNAAALPAPGSAGLARGWIDSRERPAVSPYGEIRPPVRFPPSAPSSSQHPHASAAIPIRGYPAQQHTQADVSNISPFVSNILADEQVAQLWGAVGAGTHSFRERDESGPPSGTTSRRHSVSVVQPRRGVMNFAASPGLDDADDVLEHHAAFGSTRSLMISDDELAGDFGSLSILGGPGPSSPSAPGPPSQPASLPIYGRGPLAPHSPDTAANRYIPMNLPVARGGRAESTSPGVSPVRPIAMEHERYMHEPMRVHQHPHQSMGYRSPQSADPYPFDMALPSPGHVPRYADAPYYNGGAPALPPARFIAPAVPFEHFAPPPRAPTHAHTASGGSDAEPLSDLGKGVPLHAVPPSCPLYIVEFKAGRTDLFYSTAPADAGPIRVGDLVIVEADRGRDLGKVVNDSITTAEVEAFTRAAAQRALDAPPTSPGGSTAPPLKRELNPKRIYGKAQPSDTQVLMTKMQDEIKALQLCQSKVKQKKLPMEVVDAEYQWDRRKLTFYFVSDKRIDFRELVRELFRLYKTRIWMASLQGPTPE